MAAADNSTLKPGETCAWCGHQKPAKRPAKERRVCAGCAQPFAKGQPWRLYRGKPYHNPNCIPGNEFAS